MLSVTPKLSSMNEIEEFLKQIESSTNTPRWIREKAKLLLANKSIDYKRKMTADNIIDISCEYFGMDKEWIAKRDQRKEIIERKHFLRYALFINEFSHDYISKIFKCDRSTIYNSIEVVDDISSVDETFKGRLDDYIQYLEIRKIV